MERQNNYTIRKATAEHIPAIVAFELEKAKEMDTLTLDREFITKSVQK